MKTQFKIEQATESDWPWIVQGEVEIAWVRLGAEQQKRVGRQAVEEAVARRVRRLREDRDFATLAFVARADDGTLAGFVWVAQDQNDFTGQLQASLLNQYVAEPYRDQGLGHLLLETAEEWARQQGLPWISLSIGARNTLGQRLYESLGYRVETLRMTKQLSLCEPDEMDALSPVCKENNA
jgi:ribosomal protein S18 acetylase RimI-like enzyme